MIEDAFHVGCNGTAGRCARRGAPQPFVVRVGLAVQHRHALSPCASACAELRCAATASPRFIGLSAERWKLRISKWWLKNRASLTLRRIGWSALATRTSAFPVDSLSMIAVRSSEINGMSRASILEAQLSDSCTNIEPCLPSSVKSKYRVGDAESTTARSSCDSSRSTSRSEYSSSIPKDVEPERIRSPRAPTLASTGWFAMNPGTKSDKSFAQRAASGGCRRSTVWGALTVPGSRAAPAGFASSLRA